MLFSDRRGSRGPSRRLELESRGHFANCTSVCSGLKMMPSLANKLLLKINQITAFTKPWKTNKLFI